MKFSPISIVPVQDRSTTPDVFLTDQYGKLPALNGDGPLTINQAVRLSKIVNGYTPAFAPNNNRLIYGFMITSSSAYIDEKGDLCVSISPGSGVIDKIVFKLPTKIDGKWENFSNTIPPGLPEGQVVIYFAHKDSITNNPLRPLPQDYPHYPTTEYPENQYDFDPVSICRAFYDPVHKKVVDSTWDPDETKIIISANIKYKKESSGQVTLWVDEEDRSKIEIDGISYDQQGGGFYEAAEIDGGKLSKVEEKDRIDGIHILLNRRVDDTNLDIVLDELPRTNNVYVFFNGVMYYKGLDWILDGNKIKFISNVLTPAKNIFVFENLPASAFGYMKEVFSQSNIPDGTQISIPGLNPDSEYLVFLNGLIQHDGYTVENNLLMMKHPENSWVTVLEIVQPSTISGTNYLELIYSGIANDSPIIRSFSIIAAREYLVFYNGILYIKGVDYTMMPNTLLMNFPLSSKKKVKIIGV